MTAIQGSNPFSTPKGSALDSLLALSRLAREQGRYEESAELCRQALLMEPGNLQAEIGLFRASIYQKDWQTAWNQFDVRFRMMTNPPKVTYRDKDGVLHEKPRWRGGPPPKSLLLLDEQGMGDTIQFARFLPRLVAMGTSVTLVTHRKLFHFLEKIEPMLDLRPMDEPGRVSGVEAWAPLLSLPQALGLTTDAEHGMSAPYIEAYPGRVLQWKNWLGSHGFKVGIAWKGNPKAPVDANRTAMLAALAPLAAIPGVRLISLQQDAEKAIEQVPFKSRIEVPGPRFDDGQHAFVDTAALMMSLDLVITVDTAIGHVAGALGRPYWLALGAEEADWRWLHGRQDSLWYPSVRLFRQDKSGDWWSVFAKMAETLRVMANAQGGKPLTPVSIGELYDKISILEIKRERMGDGLKRDNVVRELTALQETAEAIHAGDVEASVLRKELKAINETLWDIEDDIRKLEKANDFGQSFVDLARAVYKTNDRRAFVKSELNTLCGSALREEKHYE